MEQEDGFWKGFKMKEVLLPARKRPSVEKPMLRRTITIEFTRQLWPQPPKNSHPYWCYINTLLFYRGSKKVWEQEIPEASHHFRGFFEWSVPSMFNLVGMRVEYDKDYGWLLKFEMSHFEAFKIYDFLFKNHPEFQVSYDQKNGLNIEEKGKKQIERGA